MKNSQENCYTLSDLSELAIEADIYVNEPSKLKVKKSRVKEVIPMLDETARDLYIEQPVRIFGVHARSEFDREAGYVKHYMSAGQVTGVSEGFMAVDYDKWPQLFAETGDQRHQRLLAELKERAVGSIGISHLVRKNIHVLCRPDLLSTHHIVNRAVAPVASSYLFPEIEKALVLEQNERLDELIRILHVSKPELSATLARIQERVTSNQDPLVSLAECAEDFYQLCNYSDINAVTAAHDYLNIVAGPRFFGKIYRFNDYLPPALMRHQQGPVEICQFVGGGQYDLLMVNLAIGREVEQNDNMLMMNDNNALYAVARLYGDGGVGPSHIFLPLDKMQGMGFSVINPAEQ